MSALPVSIREASPEGDVAFIIDTWRRSYCTDSSPLFAFDKDVYFKLMARHIKALTRERDATVRIACDPADPDTIVGFAVMGLDELHYVYVRASFRKMGVARLLLEGWTAKTYSFRTRQGLARLRPEERGMTYAPRALTWADGKSRVEMA